MWEKVMEALCQLIGFILGMVVILGIPYLVIKFIWVNWIRPDKTDELYIGKGKIPPPYYGSKGRYVDTWYFARIAEQSKTKKHGEINSEKPHKTVGLETDNKEVIALSKIDHKKVREKAAHLSVHYEFYINKNDRKQVYAILGKVKAPWVKEKTPEELFNKLLDIEKRAKVRKSQRKTCRERAAQLISGEIQMSKGELSKLVDDMMFECDHYDELYHKVLQIWDKRVTQKLNVDEPNNK